MAYPASTPESSSVAPVARLRATAVVSSVLVGVTSSTMLRWASIRPRLALARTASLIPPPSPTAVRSRLRPRGPQGLWAGTRSPRSNAHASDSFRHTHEVKVRGTGRGCGWRRPRTPSQSSIQKVSRRFLRAVSHVGRATQNEGGHWIADEPDHANDDVSTSSFD